MKAFRILKSPDFRKILSAAIEQSEILKRRFRHCAARAFMILRRYKGREKRVGRQQVSSMILINALRRISPEFCILKEARREVMEDMMDIENAYSIAKGIEDKKIMIKEIATKIPSPFAFNLFVQGFVDMMKIEDKVEFLRNMHKMIKAKIKIKEAKENP